MTKRLISFFLTLVLLVAIPLEARYRYNPYTAKLDYYEAAEDVDLGDLGDLTLTGLATGNVLYYNGTAWVNLATGANAEVLTLAAGIPSWAAGGAPAAHAASHEVGGADLVDHDQLTNYLAAQHLTLPNTLAAVLTDHNAAAHVALGFLALPSTIVAVLTDHNKAAHDALLIDADTVDGEHAAAIVTNARVKAHFPDTIANILSDHNLLAHTALGLYDAPGDVDHNLTTNYVANQHINWTAAASDFSTSEDFTLTWADAADHATIKQNAVAGTEDQPLVEIGDDRVGATVDEKGEATLALRTEGVASWALWVSPGQAQFDGDTIQTEDVFVTWVDAADHMTIYNSAVTGTEDQALITITSEAEGATVDEAIEALLKLTTETNNSWSLYVPRGTAEFAGDMLWNWNRSSAYATISQANAAGSGDTPLILIDDDRTGATANEFTEATIELRPSGTYAMYINGSYGIYMGGTAGLRTNYGVSLLSNAYIAYGRAAINVWQAYYDDNGAADDIWVMRQQNEGANDTAAMFWSQENPTAMTDHNDYLTPTFVLANDEGADANDYAGVVIGERAQADIKVAHYFDFYAMTGAIDGSVDPSNAEIGATFRFGDSGSAVPNHATGPGDVLFEDDIEVDGVSYFGDATNYAQIATDGTLTLAGTARANVCFQFANASLGKGSVAPDEIIVGNYWGWSYDINDDSVFTIKLPDDYASGTDVEIHIRWAVNEAYITNSGEVRWQATWSAHPADASEAIDDAGTTDDSGDINIPATAYFLTQTLIETIPGGSLSIGDEIGITIKRIALVGGANPVADPVITCVGFIYTVDKLGT